MAYIWGAKTLGYKSSRKVSSCQAFEWGVGAIEAVFRRLEVPLPYNEDRRRIRLSNIFSLYNF